MKVLVVGSGGREHAIIKKIKENKNVETIYAYPGNGGMKDDAVLVSGSATDIEGVVSFAKTNKVDYVVVTPDDPLVLGMVDALEKEGIPCFGPKKNAAIIEGSKVFSKNLMKKYGIPTPPMRSSMTSIRPLRMSKPVQSQPSSKPMVLRLVRELSLL